ncbi:DUF993 family protein [Rathayibacter soli]|uniref:DUF993 family protein n=1 Tax=Rathayibacter soli TaxID=3144168 RepID=UPI0027E4DF4A|nr:DUF993 family protein [Glaciibacter superstes]
MTQLLLLDRAGRTRTQPLASAPAFAKPANPLRSRVAYAAAHVIPKPWAENVPGAPADLDWHATLAFRHHLWSWGLGVADAMDTAQRNMGLDAAATRELISRSAREAHSVGGALVVGVNTDHVDDEYISLDAVIDAYLWQLQFAEDAGAGVVLMASRHLARAAQSAADYERVYGAVLARAGAPVILHWLGGVFDPVLGGYFGSATSSRTDVSEASDTVIRIIEANAAKVSGIKMSLLDASAEVALRSRLPETATMFTGDDFNYVDLIAGDASPGGRVARNASLGGRVARNASPGGRVARNASPGGRVARNERIGTGPRGLDTLAGARYSTNGSYSNALLGAFAAVAPNASAAIQALDRDEPETYRRILAPTEALSRQIFAAPTFYYKTGIAFLSWLNGHQDSPSMVGGLHSARSLPHLSEIVRLANASGALEHPDLAAARWNGLLRQNGLVQNGLAQNGLGA